MSSCMSAEMFDDHCNACSLMLIDDFFISDEEPDVSCRVSDPSTHFSISIPAEAEMLNAFQDARRYLTFRGIPT